MKEMERARRVVNERKGDTHSDHQELGIIGAKPDANGTKVSQRYEGDQKAVKPNKAT